MTEYQKYLDAQSRLPISRPAPARIFTDAAAAVSATAPIRIRERPPSTSDGTDAVVPARRVIRDGGAPTKRARRRTEAGPVRVTGTLVDAVSDSGTSGSDSDVVRVNIGDVSPGGSAKLPHTPVMSGTVFQTTLSIDERMVTPPPTTSTSSRPPLMCMAKPTLVRSHATAGSSNRRLFKVPSYSRERRLIRTISLTTVDTTVPPTPSVRTLERWLKTTRGTIASEFRMAHVVVAGDCREWSRIISGYITRLDPTGELESVSPVTPFVVPPTAVVPPREAAAGLLPIPSEFKQHMVGAIRVLLTMATLAEFARLGIEDATATPASVFDELSMYIRAADTVFRRTFDFGPDVENQGANTAPLLYFMRSTMTHLMSDMTTGVEQLNADRVYDSCSN